MRVEYTIIRDALKLPPLDKKYCTPISTPVPTAEPEYSIDNKPVVKKTLKQKSEGPEVYWVQRTLKDLGYYDTKCTGKMLQKTVNAITAFQRDQKVYPSGTIDQKLIDQLAEAAGSRKESTPEPTAETVPTPAP